jgi:hypothetical protein
MELPTYVRRHRWGSMRGLLHCYIASVVARMTFCQAQKVMPVLVVAGAVFAVLYGLLGPIAGHIISGM